MDRLAMLRQMVTMKPDDPFPKYGLAMELTKRGDREEARELFDQLVEKHPDYVATYLMFGGLLAEMGDKPRAKQIYETGAQVARKAGDDRAVNEITAALADLG